MTVDAPPPAGPVAPGAATPVEHVPHAGPAGPPRRRKESVEHGTDSGYYYHLRIWHTVPCDACTEAHRIAERRRVERREGRPVMPQRRRPLPQCRQISERTDLRWVRHGLILKASV